MDEKSKRTVSFTIPSVPRPKRPTGLNSRRLRSGGLALLLLLAAVFGGITGAWVEQRGQGNNGVLTSDLNGQKKIITGQSQRIAQIAKSVGPSVVSVNVNITSTSPGMNNFFGFAQPTQEAAAGTGIVLTADGLIITNRHVVPAGTTSVTVTLSDGTELKNVKILGRTSPHDTLDIAFLKVQDTKGHKLTPAIIGDSGQVQVGDDVVAIGNALGQFQNTVTSGIISGFGRSVTAGNQSGSSSENLENLFQTDAAINSGNSGGPLVNLNGQVIGINTAVAGNAQNIGFAIPINDVKGLINQVVKNGKFERPYLGVRYIPLTADIAKAYGLKVDNGAFIAPAVDAGTPSVLSGGPADKAGIKEGDIITAVNGQKIDQNHSLTGMLGRYVPGDKVSLTIIRGSETKKIDVTLEALPGSGSASLLPAGQ